MHGDRSRHDRFERIRTRERCRPALAHCARSTGPVARGSRLAPEDAHARGAVAGRGRLEPPGRPGLRARPVAQLFAPAGPGDLHHDRRPPASHRSNPPNSNRAATPRA
jgi:hypothetical protein